MIRKRKEALELCGALFLLAASAAATLRCSSVPPQDAQTLQAKRATLCAAAEAANNTTVIRLCETHAKVEAIAKAYLCSDEKERAD